MGGASGAAVGIATYAALEANEANCRAVIAGFNSQTSTTAEKQEYAGCVDTVYGSSGDDVAFAWCLLIVIVASVVGGVIGEMNEGELLLGCIGGAVLSGVALAVIGTAYFIVTTLLGG